MFGPLLLVSVCGVGGASCGGSVALGGPDAEQAQDAGSGESSTPPPPGSSTAPTGTLAHADKVDLLLMIDNSASMGDKQELLRQAIPDLVGRLLNPLCVDPATRTVYGSSTAGACAQGRSEFAPVKDLHVGVLSSSLGGRGADTCDGTDPTGAGADRHDDDRAHLLDRTGPGKTIGAAEAPDGVLAFGPGAITDASRFLGDLQALVGGVGEFGCGLEAQLESVYRFLVQPDPYDAIVDQPNSSGRKVLAGVDATVLRQRRAFLRPDSLVAVVVLTDEDDSTVDPLAIAGQGWAFANKHFPGSVGGGAARATSACDATPTSTACTSCGFPGHASDPSCQKPGDVDATTGQPQLGYYPLAADTLNTRFFHMRQRYGLDPQFPIERYVAGFSSAKVPNRDGEHDVTNWSSGGSAFGYLDDRRCTNPLFARDLPVDAGADLCNLPAGPRSANLVVFAAITGVPPALLAPPLDWTKIVGHDPASWDYAGVDVHMLQSIAPRPGLPGPSASDTADPENGREWDTGGIDLQYACTFPLAQPRDCTDPRFQGACDCTMTPLPPLCDASKPNLQTRGKAYPGIRELSVARALGDRAIVASICPSSAAPSDPASGYRPALRALGDRMAASLVPAP